MVLEWKVFLVILIIFFKKNQNTRADGFGFYPKIMKVTIIYYSLPKMQWEVTKIINLISALSASGGPVISVFENGIGFRFSRYFNKSVF